MSEPKPEKDSPHIIARRKQEKLKRQAKERIRIVGGKVVQSQVTPPAQDIETVLAPARAAEERTRKEAEAEAIANAQPGAFIEGHGIYIGTWRSRLGKIFNAFAAPRDLSDGQKKNFTYLEAVERIAALKDWHGHDGENYASDEALHEDLRKGQYKGGWFIPPRELLCGRTGDSLDMSQADNIFVHREKGALKKALNAVTKPLISDYTGYWSSTTLGNQWPNHLYNVSFPSGQESWVYNNNLQLHCRPVRLEPK